MLYFLTLKDRSWGKSFGEVVLLFFFELMESKWKRSIDRDLLMVMVETCACLYTVYACIRMYI